MLPLPKNSPNPRLRNLTRMQNRKQRRVEDQGLRFSHQLRQDGTPQGLQVTPELAHATVQRGGMEAHNSGEQVREEAGGFAQEGAFGLNSSKLLKEGEGHDLRIRELFEGLVAPPSRVELVVGVVYSAEQNG
jgi:hypothetical protein